MYATQVNHVRKLSKDQCNMLREMCHYSNNLFNYSLYNIRQHYFDTNQLLDYKINFKRCRENENYLLLHPSIAISTIRKVEQSFRSFYSLSSKGDDSSIKIPHYRKKGGLFNLTMPADSITIKNGFVYIPMSPMFRMTHPNRDNILIPFPKRIDQNKVKMIHIIPCCKGKEFKIQYIYEASKEQKNLNKDNALSIDLGIDNLATCVTSFGHSFIMDGRRIKSINHQWNKEMARLRSIAAKQVISATLRIQKITKKRNNRINDTIKKSARYIINYCIENNIGTLIIGYTANFKSNPTLGKINNQNFVQIPLVHLINQLQYLCWKYDIDCILQEESYTSKSSFLDLDILPIYQNELPCTNTFSGHRIHRGLYQSKKGTLINADVNGSANIMRKCKQNLNYEKLCKGLRVSPQRIRVI